MKSSLLFIAISLTLSCVISCGKSSDYYYKEFLDEAEIARPGMVDSLQIFPGKNRAKLNFLVPPDRRVKNLLAIYSNSLSAEKSELTIDIGEQDYGNFKEVMIEDLPEATLIVDIISYSNLNDISNAAKATSQIYGSQYISTLSNRIFNGISKNSGVTQITFLAEAGLPQNRRAFTNMQKTEIVYPSSIGDSLKVEISPYDNSVILENIAPNGSLKFRTIFMPTEHSIDLFYGPWSSINF